MISRQPQVFTQAARLQKKGSAPVGSGFLARGLRAGVRGQHFFAVRHVP